jgi:cytidylate kinase
MVRAVNETLPGDASVETPLLIVELVGPAGAGKTTLSRALCHRDGRISIVARFRVRKLGHLPFFVSNALLLLPTFLHEARQGRRLAWHEIKAMVYLTGWQQVVRREAPNHSTVVILDQGPVFQLARLHGFGPENIHGKRFEKWWAIVLERWASALDMVIWLDAPDAILLDRIRTRSKWHLVKDEPEQEACKFLARYRTSYEQMISALTANSGPRVLRFDTEQESPDRVADNLLLEFGLRGSCAEPVC